jgi:alginate O-acetyltransferase complex protein AlgJ
MSDSRRLSREEIAQLEIGHTDSTPAINWFLTLFFLATITAVPLLQFARECVAIRAGQESGRTVPQCLDVVDCLPCRAELETLVTSEEGLLAAGSRVNARMLRDIGRYETELKDRDALMQWLIPRMQIPVTAWLKGGNEDAYCGRGGWLFYRKDIDSLTGRGFLDPEVLARRAAGGSELAAPPQPDPLAAIVDFRDQLARRGIKLIVMPAPVKPSIHPEQFSSRYEGRTEAVQNPSYAAFLDRLAAEKIAVFDPAPLLVEAKAGGSPQYLRGDTHWTPAGMELVAEALAAFARQTADLPPATGRFQATPREVTNRGDVEMMLKFPAGWDVFAPQATTVRQVTDAGQPWRPDPKAEVLLLGDSFANIFSLSAMGWGERGGLAEHLSLALGLPVDAITRNDAGSFATREMLAKEMQRGIDRLAGKKLVIWEFASRELASGDWKIIPLALGDKPEAGMYVPPPGKQVSARGVVRAVSPAPKPGSVPYKDHIVMVHLAELTSADDPAATGREAVVFVWSMQDNVQTPAAGWRPGDTVALRLRPWDDLAGKYEAINRSELEDEELILAQPAWGEPSDPGITD